ncbi:CapA family protein [Halobium salinum]|uniref:CapA family protein n=1 Tax=Halobium salinum TaxID=1364940 RepID=A0ABD5PFR3_9EURY|nr:CapA family protein [Halobium salinum]
MTTSATDDFRLGFTGDVMLGRLVNERQRDRAPTAVWGTMYRRLRDLDALCVNLECCLSTRGTPWTRSYHPFHFRANPAWAVPALSDVGVSWVSLANNHVLDFGVDALEDTFGALDDAGIPYSGAGPTEREAWAPAAVEVAVDGADDPALRVALLAVTDNTPEFAAGDDSPGTAYVAVDPDDPDCRSRVGSALGRARRLDPDLLVCSLHWGPNMVERPPERFRRFARWLVDSGVDLVYGHSAHVFQGVERYGDGLILYDTGDFVDDYAVHPRLRNDRGFLFTLRVGAGGDAHRLRSLRLTPTVVRDCAVGRTGRRAAAWSRARMCELSASFGTEFAVDGRELVLRLDS